jgi:chromosomal replication initiation ATPase DnaA
LSGTRARPRQIALDLGHATARTRDDIVVTPSNAEAVDAIDRWPDWDAPFLLLVGRKGAGKTHLLNAWAERAGALLMPVGALSGLDLANALPPVAVDDADDASRDEAGLFHLLNAAKAGGASVLLAASRPPSAWNVRLPDLLSRLRLAAAVELKAPDDALLAGVVAKLFADRQVEVDPGVVQFVARRIERSLGAAAAAVDALDRAAMESKSPITRPLAAALFPPGSEAGRGDE